MASLMEELIMSLENIEAAYGKLLKLSMEKTPIIISADLDNLARITDEEQQIVNEIGRIESKRSTNMKDIADVINKDVNTLKLADLIDMLSSRPAEQKRLATIYDKLTTTVGEMRRVNDQNKALLESSLEMVQFDMNVLQAYKAAPETANYDSMATNAGTYMGVNRGGFDAKQ